MEREREERFSVIARRLKEAREKSGITQDEVSALLLEKYDVSISTSSIKNYEIEHSTPGRPMRVGSMSTEVLQGLSKLYGVSSDYLLGLTDIKTKDTELAAVCEYTGLGEKAVKKLKEFKEVSESYPGYMNISTHISSFVANADYSFFDIFEDYVFRALICANIQKKHPDFDISKRAIYVNFTGENKDKIEELKKDHEIVEKISVDDQPLALFKLQKMFMSFIEQYTKYIVDTVSIEEFEKIAENRKQQSSQILWDLSQMMDQLNNVFDNIPDDVIKALQEAQKRER